MSSMPVMSSMMGNSSERVRESIDEEIPFNNSVLDEKLFMDKGKGVEISVFGEERGSAEGAGVFEAGLSSNRSSSDASYDRDRGTRGNSVDMFDYFTPSSSSFLYKNR